MTSTTDAEVAARYGVSVDEDAEGIAEPWNTDGGNVRAIAQVSEWTGKAAAWLVIPLMVVLALEALRRRIFGNSFIWAQDVAYMLYATHFLLGSAFTLKRSGHIRTDFSYRKWAPRTQAAADFIIYVLFFIPALTVAIWVSGEFAWEAFERREKVVRSAWQDGPLWLLLAVLPIALAIWLLQSISEAVKSYRVMRTGDWEPSLADQAAALDDDGPPQSTNTDTDSTDADSADTDSADADSADTDSGDTDSTDADSADTDDGDTGEEPSVGN